METILPTQCAGVGSFRVYYLHILFSPKFLSDIYCIEIYKYGCKYNLCMGVNRVQINGKKKVGLLSTMSAYHRHFVWAVSFPFLRQIRRNGKWSLDSRCRANSDTRCAS